MQVKEKNNPSLACIDKIYLKGFGVRLMYGDGIDKGSNIN